MSDLSDAAAMYAKQCAKQREELDRLRAANARLQAWHDAVVGQESTVSQYYDAIGRRHFTRLGETFEQIGYQCQPLIIRPQPLAKE